MGKVLKDRICAVCGNKFDVELGDENKIPREYFFSKIDGEEYWECKNCSDYMMDLMKEWMLKNWGEKCPDYEPSCGLCKAWKYFDYLFDHVVEDNKERERRERWDDENI